MMPFRFMGFESNLLGGLAEPFARVATGRDLCAPRPVANVPVDGPRQSRRERLQRPPAELSLELGAVDRVAPVMAGPVRHELDLRRVGTPILSGSLPVEEQADHPHGL